MEYTGTRKLKKIGGSYALILPIEWVKDNDLDNNNARVKLFIKDSGITLFPMKQKAPLIKGATPD